MKLCTIHASGVFSLFSAMAFAQRRHKIRRVVFFDRKNTFKSRSDFLDRAGPVLKFFAIGSDLVTYVTDNAQAAANFAEIYNVEDSRILFAESLQSKENQALVKLICPKQIHFYAEGAMSYGPIRDGLPTEVSSIIHSVHYVDYGGLPPIALDQFRSMKDAKMPAAEFGSILKSFFDLLDADYRHLTEIDDFLARVPQNSIAIVHQNLSAIAGFEEKDEGSIFKSIHRQVNESWNGDIVIFMHPKGVKAVKEIFNIYRLSGNGQPAIFVEPRFPFVEYYVHKLAPRLTVGIFSTTLLNLFALAIPVLTMETHFIGGKIKSAFDSNLYALHFVQLVLGSYEHDKRVYPNMDIDRLKSQLVDNNTTRCGVKNLKLWKLPYYVGDHELLRKNFRQTQEDYKSLTSFTKMPAFRRMSPARAEMLKTGVIDRKDILRRQRNKSAMKFVDTLIKKVRFWTK